MTDRRGGSKTRPAIIRADLRLAPTILFVLLTLVAAADTRLPAKLQDVGIDQKLNAQLPLDLHFKDETGKQVALRDYFGKKPVLLTFAYFDCPMLCSYVLGGTVSALRVLKFDAGNEFNMLTISFDTNDSPTKAAASKAKYVKDYNRPGADQGWHFLTADAQTIRKITDAAGFHYKYDEATKQFAHASGIMIVTPEGKMSRYFYGVEYSPRDLRLGLVEASENKIGSAADKLLLFCYHYNPSTGKYGVAATNAIRVGGVATILALGIFIVTMTRKERHV